MKILILSFYYPPDLSAGSFRVAGLVNALLGVVGKNIEIEIVTTQPNRYRELQVVAGDDENSDRLKIHRIKIPSHSSGMLDQARSFIFYAYEVLNIIKSREYDFVFSTSSRLMTATLGSLISRWKNIPLYLDIRDIFVDTIQDILPKKYTYFLMPIISFVERFTIGQAFHINLVSPGFKSYFRDRYPKKSFSCYTNGIDDEFLINSPQSGNVIRTTKKTLKEPISILYAGNIGEGQGLHKVIPMLAKRLGDRVTIRVIGSGGRIKELQDALNGMGLINVELIPPMERADLIQEYKDADVLFLHLNNFQAFKKVLPSKIFEYAALGKPILAGVSGYASHFLQKEVSNSAIFSPCDVDSAIKAFESLIIEENMREKFIEKYSRKNIMKLLSRDIIESFERG